MRFSFVRTGIVATAAAIALAACGGRGIVPSQSAAPDLSLVPQAANPCYTSAVQPAWIFKGSCKITKLPPGGTKIALAAYKGMTETVTLPKNTGKDGAFVLVDAVGGADITKYKTLAMPKLPSTVGKSALYVEAVNATKGLMFTAGSLVFLTKGTFPGKTCTLSLLQQRSKTSFAWTATIQEPVKAGAVTYTIPYTALATFFQKGLPAGPLYFNVACG